MRACALNPHVAVGQRACLGWLRFPSVETLPLAFHLALLLLHFSCCTSPFALLLLHSSEQIFCREPAQYHLVCFQIGFLQVVFFLVVFPKEILLILGCLWAHRLIPSRCRGSSFFRIDFRTSIFYRILKIFIGCWLPFGLQFSLISYRFFIDFGMVFHLCFIDF